MKHNTIANMYFCLNKSMASCCMSGLVTSTRFLTMLTENEW
jgi:hypothetical protein